MREKAAPFAPVIALLLLLVCAAVFGIYLGWALIAGAVLFTLDAKCHGRTWNQVGQMLAQGLKKAWIVVQVLLIIGLLTASWISCGTIRCLVHLGALVIRPPPPVHRHLYPYQPAGCPQTGLDALLLLALTHAALARSVRLVDGSQSTQPQGCLTEHRSLSARY